MVHDPNDQDGSSNSGHHSLGPRRTQATPGNHRHIVGDPREGFISETLFDPTTDIINGSYSGTAFKQLLDLLEKYGLVDESTKIVGSGNWKWTDALSGNPGTGYVGDNAVLSPDSTQIRISKTSNGGQTISGENIQSGDLFMIIGDTAAGGYEVVTVTDMGDWLSIETNYVRGSGNFVDQELVTVAWYPGGSGHEHPEYLEPAEVLGGSYITVTNNGDGTITITNISPGTLDHGSLLGLTDNDHPQYLMADEVLAGTNVTITDNGDGTITIASVGGGGDTIGQVDYLWHNLNYTSDPGPGFVATDVNNPNAANFLQVSSTDSGGENRDQGLSLLVVDDIIILQSKTNSAKSYRFVVDGIPMDNGTWWSVPVRVESSGSGGEPFDNDPITLLLYFSNGGGGGSVEETYYQPEPPPSPAVADIWVDSDGITANPVVVTNIPIGGFMFHAGSSVPAEWLLCNGQAVSRTNYAALFAEIGTTFGAGDNVNTFNVPNLIDRFPLGEGAPGVYGGTASHAHPGTDWRTGFTNIGSTGNGNGAPDGTGNTDAAPNGTGDQGDHNHQGSTDNTSITHSHGTSSGGSHSHGGQTGGVDYGNPASGGTFSDTGTQPRNHGHNISSQSAHSHGSTGDSGGTHKHSINGAGGHNHGVPGSNHSHSVPNSVHTHGIPSSNHDHNIPASTSETNVPPYLTLLPIIYSGVV